MWWGDLELEGRAGEGGPEAACISRMLDPLSKIGRIVLLNTAYPVWVLSVNLLALLLFKLIPRRYSPSHRRSHTFSRGGRIGENEECECIVFSKDRALQLHALLALKAVVLAAIQPELVRPPGLQLHVLFSTVLYHQNR